MEKYFSKTTEEALNYLKVSKEGLSTRQAKENLSTYGFNELNQKKTNIYFDCSWNNIYVK